MNSVIYYKPTNLTESSRTPNSHRAIERVSHARRPDHHAPGPRGSTPTENTSSAADNFNEAEAAYLLQIGHRERPGLRTRRGRLEPTVQAGLQDPALAVVGPAHRDAEQHPPHEGRAVQVGREAAGPSAPGEPHRPPHDPRQRRRDGHAGTGHRDRRRRAWRSHTRGAVRQWCRLRRIGGLRTSSDLGIGGTNGLDGAEGAVEFWYQPNHNHDSISGGTTRVFWWASWNSAGAWSSSSTTTGSGKNLHFRTSNTSSTCAGAFQEVVVSPGLYSWRWYDWVHIRAEWSATRNQMRILVNGAQVGSAATYSGLASPSGDVDSSMGGAPQDALCRAGPGHADGMIDEFYIYAGAGSSAAGNPDSIGYAGLTGVRTPPAGRSTRWPTRRRTAPST